MKIVFKNKLRWLILACLTCGVFASGLLLALAPSFESKRTELPARLEVLRERMDRFGGKDASVALLVGSRNKAAQVVCSTVLVYQEHPRERQLSVLLAAMVRYNERLATLQGVREEMLKRTLLQAPAELEEMEGIFSALDELENMSDPQFKNALDGALRAKDSSVAASVAVRQVKQQLNQTAQADRD